MVSLELHPQGVELTVRLACIRILVCVREVKTPIENKHFVPYSEVSLTQGLLGIFLVGMVLCNGAVELNVATLSELSVTVCWQERLSRG